MSAPEHCTVRYTNWRGETSDRRLILGEVRFGSTEWHPKPTWLINAFDLDHPAQIWKEFDLTKCNFTRTALSRPKVKPLVWSRADLSAWGEYADAGLIRYRMTWTYRDDPDVWFKMVCEHDNRVLYEGGDEDAAIAAANADCSARILSALVPAQGVE